MRPPSCPPKCTSRVAAHSKARLDPHLPPIAHSHTAPVPNARVAALSHPLAGTLPARGRQVPHLEPARPGSLFELELAGIKRRAEKNDSGLGAGGAAVCKYTPKIALQTCVCVIVCYSGATRRRSLDAGGGSCNVLPPFGKYWTIALLGPQVGAGSTLGV